MSGKVKLQERVNERVRELEAYLSAQEQAATELMTDKDIYIRELEAERDQLREANANNLEGWKQNVAGLNRRIRELEVALEAETNDAKAFCRERREFMLKHDRLREAIAHHRVVLLGCEWMTGNMIDEELWSALGEDDETHS